LKLSKIRLMDLLTEVSKPEGLSTGVDRTRRRREAT